ncbi:hypothetical protein ACPL_8400 [Actinoplanes sp. SE50/110]|nr:hypothetical protein ACPL_8400 [Actinoplanes sp. SE50/110]SLM02468.1 hypothetical protein ACSP50_5718 [Actinoplanes sp. SE50/110]
MLPRTSRCVISSAHSECRLVPGSGGDVTQRALSAAGPDAGQNALE